MGLHARVISPGGACSFVRMLAQDFARVYSGDCAGDRQGDVIHMFSSSSPVRKSQNPTAPAAGDAFGPPLTDEELRVNLSVLQHQLNGEMKCPAGRGQVYIRSLLTGRTTTRPRIALKCSLKKSIGQPHEVFYEEIKNVCCGNPDQCEAYKKFKDRFVST